MTGFPGSEDHTAEAIIHLLQRMVMKIQGNDVYKYASSAEEKQAWSRGGGRATFAAGHSTLSRLRIIMSGMEVSTCHQEGTISRINSSQCVEGGPAEDGTCLDPSDVTEQSKYLQCYLAFSFWWGNSKCHDKFQTLLNPPSLDAPRASG